MTNKVNLFLVGAMKAGTTTLVDLLAQHDDIYVPPVKEPHFFVDALPESLYEPNKFFSLERYLDKDFPEPLHITKINTEDQYESVYRLKAAEQFQLDASTAYLHAPEAAKRIYEYNPNARIIIILRDPLERTFSHYKMDVGLGRTKTSFEALIQEEIVASQNGSLPWYSRLGMSFYTEPIKRFQHFFGEVLLIQFDDLIHHQETVLKDITSFLDIEEFSEVVFEHKNIARKPLFPRLMYFLKQLGLKHYFSKIFSSTFKQWLSRRISSKTSFTLELSEETRTTLERIFKQESSV